LTNRITRNKCNLQNMIQKKLETHRSINYIIYFTKCMLYLIMLSSRRPIFHSTHFFLSLFQGGLSLWIAVFIILLAIAAYFLQQGIEKWRFQDFAYFNMKYLASLWMPVLSFDAFSFFWGVYWYFFYTGIFMNSSCTQPSL